MKNNVCRTILCTLSLVSCVFAFSLKGGTSSDVKYIIYRDGSGNAIFNDVFHSGYTFNNEYHLFNPGLKYLNVGWSTKPAGSVTITNVMTGEYIVTEAGWSWAYDVDGGNSLTQDIEKNNVFQFKNTAATGTPLHGEGAKRNVM